MTQITNIKNVKYTVTTDSMAIKRIIKKYYEQNYADTFDNLGEMD